MFLIVIIFLVLILLYSVFFPKTDAVYKDEDGAQVRVLDFTWKTVIIQYIKFDAETGKIEEITGPQNIGLFKFIANFNLWTLM